MVHDHPREWRADTINVGSLSPGVGGNVNGIAGLLTISGGGGADTQR